MSDAKQEIVSKFLDHTNKVLEKDYDRPASTVVSREGPQQSLWNIFNVLEVVSDVLEDGAESSRDLGIRCMIEECKSALCFEALHVETILNEYAEKVSKSA